MWQGDRRFVRGHFLSRCRFVKLEDIQISGSLTNPLPQGEAVSHAGTHAP